jgi:hypothetical protein
MCVVALSYAAYAQDVDSFIRQRDAEAAKNNSSGFSVSFADAQRTFHREEMIKMWFTFGDRHSVWIR